MVRKLRSTSTFKTSQTGKQIITISILPNISRCKDNHTTRFGQLIECKIRNIFLEKSNAKCGGETSYRPFPEKSKFSISVDQQSKVLYSLHVQHVQFLLYVQVEGYRNILKLRCRPIALASYKAFLKNKNRSATSLLLSFSA